MSTKQTAQASTPVVATKVMRSERYALPEQEGLRHQLLWLNSMRLWLVPFKHQQALLAQACSAGTSKAPAVLSPHFSQLLARYVRAYLHRFSGPCFDHLPMQVNQLSSVWAPAQASQLEGVCAWLRISTLTRGERIELPIRRNAYADRFAFEHATTFSLFPRDGGWYVKMTKQVPKAAARTGAEVGLDFGMRTLLATSKGDLFGRGFNERLRRWDAALLRITQGLQRAGELRLRECRRYRDFVHRFRCWLGSNVRRAVNQVLALRQPGTVVIEELGFSAQEGALSARMNRLVRRMGTGVFKEALAQKSETQGFKLVEVNPAYTSQECASCGFIHRDNRRGDRFKCVSCGCQAHADAKAARIVLERFQTGRSGTNSSHTPLGVQGLKRWAGHMAARLLKATPGTARHQGALGYARAGLAALERKTSLVQRSKALRETWNNSVELKSLLNAMSAGRAVQLC